MIVNIKTDFKEILDSIKKLQPDIRDRVMKPALRLTANNAKVALVREIAQNYNLDRTSINQGVAVKVFDQPLSTSSGVRFDAVIITSHPRQSYNLIRFLEKSISLAAHRRRKKAGDSQLRARISKRGSYKPLGKNVFIGNNGRTVFMVPKSEMSKPSSQRKIRAFSTINLPMMSRVASVADTVMSRINEQLPKNINSQLERLLK